MHRIYLMTPKLENITAITKKAQDLGIPDTDIRLVKHEEPDENKLILLQFANPKAFERLANPNPKALEHVLAKGGVIGAIIGLALAFLMLHFFPNMLILDNEKLTIISFTLVAGILGMFIRYRIGIPLKDPLLIRFRNALINNENMIVIDIPEEKTLELLDYIRTNYPEIIL